MKTVYALALFPALAVATGTPNTPQPASAQQSQTQQQAATQAQTATATQTQSAASNQSQTASNAGNQQVSTYDYPRQTASAYAPAIAPTVVCATGKSGGVSTSVFGIAGGTSGIDIECETRETARLFAEIGYRETAALVACTTVAAQRAFNGRPCPIKPEPMTPPSNDVTVRIEDVRTERAEARGFVPSGK